jgi:hypothetical protein
MAAKVRPIRTKRDYETALKEVERLWGAKAGTRDGDRLDVLATLIDAYETEHHPMARPILLRRSSSAWSSKDSRAEIWKKSPVRARGLRRF